MLGIRDGNLQFVIAGNLLHFKEYPMLAQNLYLNRAVISAAC